MFELIGDCFKAIGALFKVGWLICVVFGYVAYGVGWLCYQLIRLAFILAGYALMIFVSRGQKCISPIAIGSLLAAESLVASHHPIHHHDVNHETPSITSITFQEQLHENNLREHANVEVSSLHVGEKVASLSGSPSTTAHSAPIGIEPMHFDLIK